MFQMIWTIHQKRQKDWLLNGLVRLNLENDDFFSSKISFSSVYLNSKTTKNTFLMTIRYYVKLLLHNKEYKMCLYYCLDSTKQLTSPAIQLLFKTETKISMILVDCILSPFLTKFIGKYTDLLFLLYYFGRFQYTGTTTVNVTFYIYKNFPLIFFFILKQHLLKNCGTNLYQI